jgi:acetyltransferase-like isoleucine patch superfamily enzyme
MAIPGTVDKDVMVESEQDEARTSAGKLQVGSRKPATSKFARLSRLLLSCLDPRAYLHMFRMANYYNTHHVKPRRQLKLGKSSAISPDVIFSNAERILIGDNAKIGSRTHLWAGPSTGRIFIGNDVLIGPDVMITAATYRFNDGYPVTNQLMDEGDVVIGNDVWLGTKVVILPGVTIGDGAVVGASAVVTKNIPKNGIAAGIPAKLVGQRKLPTV